MKRYCNEDRRNHSIKTEAKDNSFDDFSFNNHNSYSISKILKPTENSKIYAQHDDFKGSFCWKYKKSKMNVMPVINRRKKEKENANHVIELKNVVKVNGLNKIKTYLRDKGIL